MNHLEKCFFRFSKILRSNSHQPTEFRGNQKPPRGRVPFPIADLGNPLCQTQPCLASEKCIERETPAQHVPDSMAQNRRIRRFGDEIRGAVRIGTTNRVLIIQRRHHQDRHTLPFHRLTQLQTGGKSIHHRHHHVHDDQVGTPHRKLL